MTRWVAALIVAGIILAVCAMSGTAGAERFGVMLDAGVPDGVTGSLVFRPISRVRVHAGAGYNLIAPGVRAGATVVAFPFWITPSASLEVGHYFRGDANGAVRMITGDAEFDEPMLRDVGYSYANGHLGLELGHSRVTFYLHAGMSVVQGTLRQLQESLDRDAGGDPSGMDSDGAVEIRDDPSVRIVSPSARTGLIVYF